MTRQIALLDLAFLLLDRPETPANVGALLLFDPPPGRAAASVATQVVRAYRAAQPGLPFDSIPDLAVLALPRWRPAPHVDLRQHVLRATLSAPGDLAGLCRLVALLHEAPLDRSRPLFSLHVIDGLASGQLAIYLKSHHAYWDGRYALERIFGQLRSEPGPIQPPFFAAAPNAGQPPDAQADGQVDAHFVAAGLRAMVTQASAARELFGKLATRARAQRASAQLAANRPFSGPHTRFNDPVAAGRSIACFSLPLDALRRVARACDATLNDVALAIVDSGVERLLASLGERPRDPLVAMCPVSLRTPGDREATTKAATMFVPLARPRTAALERLRQIAANTRAAKREFGELSHEAALDYALLVFGLWLASNSLGLGAITRPAINFAVSNIGGVEGTRYLGRCRLASAYPVSMIADPTGLNVTVLSVEGRMDFGIVANAAVLADAFELARECQAAFMQLERAAHRARPVAARKRGPQHPR
jgi:WS/DGAT/MGAT family acyltransferase